MVRFAVRLMQGGIIERLGNQVKWVLGFLLHYFLLILELIFRNGVLMTRHDILHLRRL